MGPSPRFGLGLRAPQALVLPLHYDGHDKYYFFNLF